MFLGAGLDSNNIQITWYGTASIAVMFSIPSVFVNTVAAYNAAAFPTGDLVEYWPCNESTGATPYNTATVANPMTLGTGLYTWRSVICRLLQGSRVRSMVGHRATAVPDRRQGQIARYE